MIMIATVIRTGSGNMLVRDSENDQEVLVFTSDFRSFSPGDRVRITYSGAMTRSIPPQITAISIEKIQHPTPPSNSRPSEFKATVIQRRNNSLLVRDITNNRQVHVNYRYAHHFCPRQQIIVKYDTIKMSNPVEVNATDITPVC